MTEEDLGKKVGIITSYFSKVKVGIIKVESPIKKGDKIRIKGTTTDFEQSIDSMQIDHEEIEKTKKGDEIGLKVKDKVRPNDTVYLQG
ncbi:translation elongation factor-like protein [archaeon]|nr:translation elongation factor-like protein [archaeon]